MDSDELMTGAAWRAFCERMAGLGDRLLDDDFPGSEQDRAEGYRHLATQLACWLTYSTGHTDPAHPLLFWHNNLVYRWGGPNVDQNARRCVIDGSGTYRLSGNTGAAEEFIVQVKGGEMHTGDATVAAETSASKLGIGPGEDFEIVLGGAARPGRWLGLEPSSRLLHIRDYYFDWQARAPATFVIERIDTQGHPVEPLTPGRVAVMLDEAARQIESSMEYWNTYQSERRRQIGVTNAFEPPRFEPAGVHDVRYSDAFIALADDEALVVEVDPTDARLWDVQLYSRAWYESLDFANRVTSLNHRQAQRDPDGRIRVVVAGQDPGVANWLDTEGRTEVMATMRWWRLHRDAWLRSTVVPLAGLRGHLPPDTPAVDADARRRQRRSRAAHVAWRYRT